MYPISLGGCTNSIGPVSTSIALDQITPDDGIIDAQTEINHSLVPTYQFRIENSSDDVENFDLIDKSQLMIIHIAAICNETLVIDCEFRSAQCRTYATGEWPHNSNSDHRCMATLIKVNGLKAYALLDSGGTTV